ncbi:hypothetical protein ACLIBH_01960 [Virgibacillus sp. W0430]|uniref:hypothetical protein n=1 Tax=Virgibacillus sp. W0430 TaxID=3391580 RepID=UPI003F462145
MRKNKLDKEIKKTLNKETEPAEELKQLTWNRIENELFSEQIVPVKRKAWSITAATITAIVIAVVWIGSAAPQGETIMHTLRDLFVEEKERHPETDPEATIEDEQEDDKEENERDEFQKEIEKFVKEKEVEIELEGIKEVVHTELKTNDTLRYIIYIDTSRYTFEKGEARDLIVPNPPIGEDYPEVAMEIKRMELTVEEARAEIRRDIEDENMELFREEQVEDPIAGYMMMSYGEEYTDNLGITARHWDTPVYRYYIAKQKDGDVFIITQKSFFEALEGHSARFDAMLESFEVIE